VEKVNGRDVHTTVVYGGLLKQYKGINLPGTEVSADILTEKDIGDLKVALEHKADFVASPSCGAPAICACSAR
jgi:pyruvate kinase